MRPVPANHPNKDAELPTGRSDAPIDLTTVINTSCHISNSDTLAVLYYSLGAYGLRMIVCISHKSYTSKPGC